MTGYSKKETRLEAGVLSVEILSENNRYLDLTLNLPEPLMQYTEELKRLITGDLRRGRVRIVVRLNGSNATAALGYNSEVLKKYYWALTELAHELKIEQPVTLQNLLSFPDIFKADIVALDLDEIITQVKTLLSSAVTELVAMRRREGEYLAQDLQNHLEIILSKSDEVEALSRQSRQ
ncbi:MAG: YicC/YloC family endoribonuclease, partial [Candidatus Neomarinimicrobiota bacterium]